MMTPDEIRSLRASHRLAVGDFNAATGLTEFVDRTVVASQLADEAGEIRRYLENVADFTEACGYGWATDPASYDVPSEAAFQRRLLLMLAKYWVETDDAGRGQMVERASGLVALQEFVMGFGLSTPRLRLAGGGCRFVSLPAGFSELGVWLFTGLRCWCAKHRKHPCREEDGGWTLATEPVDVGPPQAFDHVTTSELLARTLAECGRDRSLYGVNAVVLIRERVPSLAGESRELDFDNLRYFEQNSAYMLSEFAIAHELGHALLGHSMSPIEAEVDPQKEDEADKMAALLLAMSAPMRVFGWGENPHPPWVQAAIGFALFDCFLSAKDVLVNGIVRRVHSVSDRDPAAGRHWDGERIRAATARFRLVGLLKALVHDGFTDEAQRLSTLVDNNNAYLRDLAQSVRSIPDADVVLALEAARASVDLRE